MKQLLKLITLSTTLFCIFSCSGGSGGPTVAVAPASELPDARTIPSIKSLKVEADHILCGSSFSSELADKQMLIKTSFNDDKTFSFAITFHDSPCFATGTNGNKIATYNFSGVYAVTDIAGHVVMTVTNSTMTILAGDYPAATKKFVDWMNSCSNLEGSFSSTQNTTLSLPLGPKCDANVTHAYKFIAHGSSQETTEEELNHLLITETK
ncbi:hypothetical protein CIK05_14235 [Bdellovibrio sp. qaytius]|nr:hypothetical protein CIK05_14235 [Bdellovibrio sp. qaytius]